MEPFRFGHARAVVAFSVLTACLILSGSREAFALPGNVLSEQKISNTTGGFMGSLDNDDNFGSALAWLGDLDGDGVADVAVGAPFDDDGGTDRGAVWIVFLNADGTVKEEAKISDTVGGLSGSLDNGDRFGHAVASLGDLDNDSVPDLAVGALTDDDGGTDRGAVWILFLNADGTVKDEQKISSTSGSFGGIIDNGDNFGSALASLGDLDSDGVVDLAVGAQFDDDGGADRGAVHILFLQANGNVGAQTKISSATAGLTGSLDDGDGFGASAARLDDLDNDGVRDLVVGAVGDDDDGLNCGAVYVLFLTAAGGLDAAQKISDLAGGFAGVLDAGDMFGQAVAEVRDLNNDGRNEIAVGSVNDDDIGPNRGAVWMLFMNTDGTVALHRKISAGLGGLTGPLDDGDMFGRALTSPRDLDGDGVADLVVGTGHDDDGGTNRGAAYVLFLDGVPGAFCGDEVLDPGEDCDDGNNDTGDCCSPSCTFDIAGTSCIDGNVCNGDETCDGSGNCDAGTPLECDDGDLCTQDLCHPVDGCQATEGPANICFFAGRVKFDLIDKPDDTKDKLNWKWTKGEELVLSDFGTPTTTTQYALCIYDGEAGTPVLERKLDIPAGASWVPTTTKGFKYKDKTAMSDGVVTVQLKIGPAGKSKVAVKAKGTELDPPMAEGPSMYFQQNPNVVVQLLNSEGLCWSSEFLPPAKVSLDDRFKDAIP